MGRSPSSSRHAWRPSPPRHAGGLLYVLLVAASLSAASQTARAAATGEVAKAACRLIETGAGVPPGRLRLLARGFSLPGWVDEAPARPPSEAMLRDLRSAGLSHVRLPLRLEHLHPRWSAPADIERAFETTDAALTLLLRLGFAVSVDMHPGERFGDLHTADPPAGLAVLIETWREVARRYAQLDAERVFFEVLNEPVVPPDVWREQGPRVVAAIRAAAPGHTLIYGPANYQRHEALEALEPLADRNIVYAFHFYDPMAFTHQGMSWSTEPIAAVANLPFPGGLKEAEPELARLTREGRPAAAAEILKQYREPWTAGRIESIFAGVARWMLRSGRPVIVNEFGVLAFKAPPQARAAWIRAVRRAAERHCIGWTHWEYADGFGFVRRQEGRESLDPSIAPALLDRSP